MRTLPFAFACGLMVLSMGGAVAADKAATAGGSGQSQASPSTEARPPAVTEPTTPETAGGSGQGQAAPSGAAKSLTPVAPAAGPSGDCPAGQVLQAGGGCAPGQPGSAADEQMPTSPHQEEVLRGQQGSESPPQ
jgi:hypothetical protein